jgi:hypothetical protein
MVGNWFQKDFSLLPEKKVDMCSKAHIRAISLLVFCAILAITISGCGAGGGNAALITSNSETTGPGTGDIVSNGSGTSTPKTLAWEAPLTYNDGITPITPGDLTAYRIYIYSDANLTSIYADYLVTGPNPPTSINLIDLNNTVFTDEISHESSTTYYLTITAIVTVNGTEIESAPSNSVSYTYP